MALLNPLNPVNALVVPFLVLFTLPLAVLASITTMFAFSVLIFRVVIVYLDLALGLIPSYLLGRRSPSHGTASYYDIKTPASSAPGSVAGVSPPLTPGLPGARPRRRRPSSASAVSAATGTVTPVGSDGAGAALGFTESVGLVRDFEGVGGWRLDDADGDQDELWTRINSRLELPDRSHAHSAHGGQRTRSSSTHQYHHCRSLSGGVSPVAESSSASGVLMMRGARSYSPEKKLVVAGLSPNSSRMRTPLALTSLEGDEGYFPMVSLRTVRKTSPPRASSLDGMGTTGFAAR